MIQSKRFVSLGILLIAALVCCCISTPLGPSEDDESERPSMPTFHGFIWVSFKYGINITQVNDTIRKYNLTILEYRESLLAGEPEYVVYVQVPIGYENYYCEKLDRESTIVATCKTSSHPSPKEMRQHLWVMFRNGTDYPEANETVQQYGLSILSYYYRPSTKQVIASINVEKELADHYLKMLKAEPDIEIACGDHYSFKASY